MKEIVIKLYSYDELSEKAKEKARLDYISIGDCWPWGFEANATIAAFEKTFKVSIDNWRFDSCGSRYDVNFNLEDDVAGLKGERARSWFWNNVAHEIYRPRTIWSKGPFSASSRSRKSRMSVSCDCPWTGVCYDMDALSPVLDFMECKDRDCSKTVKDVIRAGVDSMFKSFVADCKYHESEECFAELCEANEWTFEEDGTMRNVA